MKLNSLVKVGFLTVKRPMSKFKAGLIGAGIGAGTGAIIPTTSSGKNQKKIERNRNILGFALSGGLIGHETASIRNLILRNKLGNIKRKYDPIYPKNKPIFASYKVVN